MSELYKGVDVSHHQGPERIDYDELCKNIDFAYVRATYGAKKIDARFVRHVEEFQERGIPVGAYHFYRQQHDTVEQYALFNKVTNNRELDLLPCLDIEANPRYDGSPRWDHFAREGEEFARLLESEYGGFVTYVTGGEYQLMGEPDWVNDGYVWSVHYPSTMQLKRNVGAWTRKEPWQPPKMRKWSIWQKTGHHRLPGYNDDIDWNVARELPVSMVPIKKPEPGEVIHANASEPKRPDVGQAVGLPSLTSCERYDLADRLDFVAEALRTGSMVK